MTNVRWTPLVWVSHVLDVVGAGLVLWPLRILVTAWLAWRRRKRALALWISAAVVSEAAIGLLKAAYGRARPPDPLVPISGFSFPSGHTMAATVIVVALVFVFIPPGLERRRWEIGAGVFAVCMGMSRTLLGAHWLSDAVAGTVIGMAVTIGAAAAVQWWTARPPSSLPPDPIPVDEAVGSLARE